MPFKKFEKILKSIKTSLDKQIQKKDRPNQFWKYKPVRFTFNLGEIKSFYIMLQLLWLVYMES